MVKTSLTHPLEILAVSIPSGAKIGMTLCPGKKQPNAVTGPWDRDLEIDMEALEAFGTTLLVTLMEPAELVLAGVPAPDLQAAARSRGIAWLHLPIADFQSPDHTFEMAWKDAFASIEKTLESGRNIVLHCRGGRGRSGMIAARLLVEFGMTPDKAIDVVRSANPLAMETATQESYVRLGMKRWGGSETSGTAVPKVSNTTRDPALRS